MLIWFLPIFLILLWRSLVSGLVLLPFALTGDQLRIYVKQQVAGYKTLIDDLRRGQ